jgi:hypothetical protein
LKANRRFGEIIRALFNADFLHGLFSDDKDGGDMIFGNCGLLLTDCRAIYPRGKNTLRRMTQWTCNMHEIIDDFLLKT